MKVFGVALVSLFCLGGNAWADPTLAELRSTLADRKKLEAAIVAGQRQAGFCFSCHGEHGVSLQPEVPNLAGQPVTYLIEQIRRFGDGRRRDAFMQGLLRALSDGEKLNIALYFSAQKPAVGTPVPGVNPESGKAMYVQRCQSCHGEAGRGLDLTPTVAGQKPEYLFNALKDYRDRNGDRQHKEMSESLARVADADIRHLVGYMAGLK